MITFTIEKINKNEIPLEIIAKFFKAHGVGDVSQINVVPFYIIDLGEATISETHVRLYVHFNVINETSDMYNNFHSKIENGENFFQITDTIDGQIKVMFSMETYSISGREIEHPEVSIYNFNVNHDVWEIFNTQTWNIRRVHPDTENRYTNYTNLYDDPHNSFVYIEDIYRELRGISDEDNSIGGGEQERRIDIWNPHHDFTNEYTSHSGAIGFTQEQYESYYGYNWQHYWSTSPVWKEYEPILHSSMKVHIELTIGPYHPPHSNVMTTLTTPITRLIDYIHDISGENYDEAQKSILMDQFYYTVYFVCEISDIHFNDYNVIKNYLLDIEHMCEIIKPKDTYNAFPESRIYTSFT